MHINVLELLAIELALQSFEKEVIDKHVQLAYDKSCAVSYLKHMDGSHSQACNEIAQRIWIWCQKRNVHLTITYLPGKLDAEADEQSRKFNDQTE